MIWKGTHACLYKVKQLKCMLELKLNHEVKGMTAALRDMIVLRQIWGRLQILLCLRFTGAFGLHNP